MKALAPLSSLSKYWKDVIRGNDELWALILASIIPVTALNDGAIAKRHNRERMGGGGGAQGQPGAGLLCLSAR